MKVRRWTPPLAWAAIILVATSIPNPELPASAPPLSDELAHAAIYGVLAWLASRAARPNPGGLFAVLVGVVAFAGIDEWHQQFVPGRRAELGDWLADAGGALTGTTLAALRARRGRPA